MDSMTDPVGKTTSFVYDYQGQRTVTTYPSSGSVTNNYSLIHQVTNVIDSAGVSATNWFNNQGLMICQSNGFGCQQSITYDMEDHRTNVINANSVKSSYVYDPLSRTISRTDANGNIETFTYSTLGIVAYTNQIANGTTYAYDLAGRKTSCAWSRVVVPAYTSAPASLSAATM